jgi:hypothetical protein
LETAVNDRLGVGLGVGVRVADGASVRVAVGLLVGDGLVAKVGLGVGVSVLVRLAVGAGAGSLNALKLDVMGTTLMSSKLKVPEPVLEKPTSTPARPDATWLSVAVTCQVVGSLVPVCQARARRLVPTSWKRIV